MNWTCTQKTDRHMTSSGTETVRRRYIKAGLTCLIPTAITTPFHASLDEVNTVMVYLLAVVWVSLKWGRGPAILSAFLCVGLFDFFYIPPRLSFAVSDIQYLLTFVVMLVVGLTITHLTSALFEKAEIARASERTTSALYRLAHQLAGAPNNDSVLAAVTRHAQPLLAATVSVHLSEELEQASDAQTRPEVSAVLRSVYREGKSIITDQLNSDGWQTVIVPLSGSTRSRGVMLIEPQSEHEDLHAKQALIEAIATLTATSLERLHYVEVAHQTQIDISAANLRSSILAALSHDIRTPLTGLYGMADALLLQSPSLSEAQRQMVESIRDQAFRLNRMVCNLLDMARLQSGTQGDVVQLNKEWQPIEEVIGASIQLLGHALANHKVKVDMPKDLPMVNIDAVLMERVFGNLLENAAKYSDTGSEIHIDLSRQNGSLLVQITNSGPGFPADRLNEVFDLFERGAGSPHVNGVGLGLSICKVIVESHGGFIQADNPPSGGARVSMLIPIGEPPVIPFDQLEQAAS